MYASVGARIRPQIGQVEKVKQVGQIGHVGQIGAMAESDTT